MKFRALLLVSLLSFTLFFSILTSAYAQSGQFTEPALIEGQSFVLPGEEHFFASYKNDYLKDYFIKEGLNLERPFWRKLNLVNTDKQFFKTDFQHTFELDYNLPGLIFEVSMVRDTDLFSLTIEAPNGKKTVYHNVREILYPNAGAGTYKITVGSNVFDQIGLKIYDADLIYPHTGLLLVNDDDAQYNYQNELQAFISRGGTVINLGSKNIDKYLLNLFDGFQNIEIEGESEKIKYVDSGYFYVPKDLFLEQSTAARVVKALKENMTLKETDTQAAALLMALIFAILVAGLLYKNRKDLKRWTYESLYPSVRSMAGFGIFTAVILIIIVPLFIYWYKNFSGLDLLPGITIDEIIERYNLKLLAKLILTFIAFIVVLFAILIALKSEKKHALKQKGKVLLAVDFKKNIWLFALALIVVISFLSTFKLKESDTQPKHPRLVHDAYEGVFTDSNLKIRSEVPLVLSSGSQANTIIAGTMPDSEAIKTALSSHAGNELIVYSDVKLIQFFGVFDDEVKGSLLLSNKNKEFGNKNFFLHLTDINGLHKKTIHIEGESTLLGQKPLLYARDFRFEIDEPGIYGIKIENSDPFKKGDFELAAISANTKQLISLNNVKKTADWIKEDINLPSGDRFIIEPYQLEKTRLKSFWISH